MRTFRTVTFADDKTKKERHDARIKRLENKLRDLQDRVKLNRDKNRISQQRLKDEISETRSKLQELRTETI